MEALKWEDISVETQDGKKYLPIRTKQSKADIFKDGILRSLIEVDSVLCPLATFMAWKRIAFSEWNEKTHVFGERLRGRVSAIMKIAALSNQVHDARIDTHSLRSGGATALYTQGVPLDIIQRRGRWKSLTFRQYLWHDATALNRLSDVFTRSAGLVKSLRLVNTKPKSVSFQHPSMGKPTESTTALDTKGMTQLFLPNESFRDGSTSSADMGDSLYTATPRGNKSVFFGTRRLAPNEKSEKLEKKEDSSDDGDVAKVELFSGEEEVSSRSSAQKSNATSFRIYETHGENDSTASVSKEESNDGRNTKASPGRASRDDRVIKDLSQPHRHPTRRSRRRSGDRRGPRKKELKHSDIQNARDRHRSLGRERERRTRSSPPHSSRGNHQCRLRPRNHHLRRDRKGRDRVDSRPSSGVSSSKSKIFYPDEFLKKSAEELRPASTRSQGPKVDKRSGNDILKNRTTQVLTLGMLRKRKKRSETKGSCPPIKPGVSGEDGEKQTPVREKPFQRFKPTTTVRKGLVPKLKTAPVLREYIADKSVNRSDQSGRSQIGGEYEPSSSSNQNRTEVDAHEDSERRRVVDSLPHRRKDDYEGYRILARSSLVDEPPTPRTLQMQPPGFVLPKRKQHASGAKASGSIHSIESSDADPSTDSGNPAKKKPRITQVITPEEAINISQISATEDRQALNDAEALWQMPKSPVYGDPICIEGEFIELAIRFAKRGLRWIKMAQMTTTQAANRRIRSEHRAHIGYGRLKPAGRVPVFSSHEEFEMAKAQYADALEMIIIAQENETRVVLIRGTKV